MTVKINMASGLKKARKAAGKSVEEVGAIINKSGKTISAWEVGRGQPDGDELVLICSFLGCHLSDFYGNEYKELMTGTESYDELSEDEQKIVHSYRHVSDEGKAAIMTLLKAIEKQFGWEE